MAMWCAAAALVSQGLGGCFPELPDVEEEDSAAATDTADASASVDTQPVEDTALCTGRAECAHLDEGGCLAGVCVDGVCATEHVADATPCDDGLACTTNDRCLAGVCQGASIVCDDGVACTVDSCSEEAGGCAHDPAACGCEEDVDCANDDLCDGVETCGDDGLCRSGEQVVCGVSPNPCRANVCQPATGLCTLVAANAGGACDDGLSCTVDDACVDGACVGTGRVCDDGVACTVDSCSESADGCVADASDCDCTDNASCDNGNPCDGVETCGGDGKCKAGTPITCAASTTACKRNVCVPATGECALVDDNNAVCDDGDACTDDDLCAGGVCAGTPRACSDGVACTTDSCASETGVCSHAPTASCVCQVDADCDNGDVCDGAERCDQTTWTCVGGTAAGDGTPCSDGSLCTSNEACEGGACVGDAVLCDDGLACSVDACDPVTGGCVADTSACGCVVDADCPTTNLCAGERTCGPNNTCVTGAPVTCAASTTECKKSVCVPATGLCEEVDDDGAPCDDGNGCTLADTCVGGACLSSPKDCSDGVACTVDTCAPATGLCAHAPTSSCECEIDADCVPEDICGGAGLCDQGTYTCALGAPPGDGVSCDDGSLCTEKDRCDGGTCEGLEIPCEQPNACQTASCDPATGACDVLTAVEDGEPCSDGNACTQVDQCVAGACQGSSPKICTPVSQCHNAGSCNASTGNCSTPLKPKDAACDADGDAGFCRQGDCRPRQVAIGGIKTCLLVHGAVRCWQSTSTPASAGVLYEFEREVVQVAAGTFDLCVRFADGAARCFSQSASSATANSTPDVALGGEAVLKVDVGTEHRCVLVASGDVRCWGAGHLLGNGVTSEVLADNVLDHPPVSLGEPALDLTVGADHSCALLSEGRIRCWGVGDQGQLGHGNTNIVLGGPASQIADVPVGVLVDEVRAGFQWTCARTLSGAVRCWGALQSRANGRVYGDDEPASVGGNILLGGTVAQLAEAGTPLHMCVILTTGAVRCWGHGSQGNLGYVSNADIGDDEHPSTAGPVNLGTGTVSRLAVGGAFGQASCAVMATGGLRCWGQAALAGYGDGVQYGLTTMPPPDVPFE